MLHRDSVENAQILGQGNRYCRSDGPKSKASGNRRQFQANWSGHCLLAHAVDVRKSKPGLTTLCHSKTDAPRGGIIAFDNSTSLGATLLMFHHNNETMRTVLANELTSCGHMKIFRDFLSMKKKGNVAVVIYQSQCPSDQGLGRSKQNRKCGKRGRCVLLALMVTSFSTKRSLNMSSISDIVDGYEEMEELLT